MSRIKLATVWLDGCSGCHMSLLDVDENLATVARGADLVYGPLVDAQEFPEGVDVTLVEGAVSSQDDARLVQLLRQRSRLVVALGDCAVTGNVPSMRNGIPVAKLLDHVYVQHADGPERRVPRDGVPPLLKRAVPVHEVVKVDLHVPGCPPRPDAILHVIGELLNGRKPEVGSQVKFG
jgi:NAD-reducing hydrogenase small subunit